MVPFCEHGLSTGVRGSDLLERLIMWVPLPTWLKGADSIFGQLYAMSVVSLSLPRGRQVHLEPS